MKIDLKKKKEKKDKNSKVVQLKQFSVALVGRTNVGKSTLFNRLVGRREALVSRVEGTTRDRREGKGRISGLEFTLIDTGGYVCDNGKISLIEKQINKQTEYAVEKADVVFFLLDGKVGVTAEDRAIAAWLRSKRNVKQFPVFAVVNKTEGVFAHTDMDGTCPQWEDLRAEAYGLGFGEPIGISAEHSEGLIDMFELLKPFGDLLNLNKKADRERYALLEKEKAQRATTEQPYEIETNVPVVGIDVGYEPQEQQDRDDEILQLTILGIPNSGKSTLLNTLLKKDRFITGSIPGLTRDTVSSEVVFQGRRIRVVDTPGIPKADGVLPPSLNSLSIYHAHKQLHYSHVVALILDGSRILTKHDLALAKEILDNGRGLFVVLNKSDVMQSPAAAKKQLVTYMDRYIPMAGHVPSIVVSALYGTGTDAVFPLALTVFDRWRTRVSTGILNRWLDAVTFRHPPPRTSSGKEVKLKYLTQTKARPPSFVLFSNSKEIDKTYLRFLSSCLQEEFDLNGVPIRIFVRVSENPFTVSAFTVQCDAPDMAVYRPVVAFTCHFSEAVALHNEERVFVPNIESISPRNGESDTFVVEARVEDNTLGVLTLVLGAGAFKGGEELSEEYRVSVPYDFIRANVVVTAVIEKMSMTPDYAVVRISGGQTVLQQVQTIDAIAVFPPCMTVLEVTSTVDSYLVTVYVNDPAAIRSSTLRVKEGVIRAYWGSKRNVEKDVSVEVKMVLPAGEPIELWPASGTLFVRDAEFQMDVTALFQNGCKVDASSFSGINADV
ncbi:GTP-binding protein, partial [Blastocystis sp. ATCC 50177/Nand II]